MARILLIETATSVCSAAVSIDGVVVASAESTEELQHTALLTTQIEECMRQAGLTLAEMDAVAVSRGPGSYTSLRVGVSVAKGICYALDKPLIAVDTLQALAAGARAADTTGAGYFVPMLDARRQEVWLAVYDADLREVVKAQPLIIENNSFYIFLNHHVPEWQSRKAVLAGSGTPKALHGNILLETAFLSPSHSSIIAGHTSTIADHMSELALYIFKTSEFQDIVSFEPYYFKLPNITAPKTSKI
jgi:tRNA threonylcarbamoyladenosine biosynthesis protein TsaB